MIAAGFFFKQLRHIRRYNQILSVMIKYGFDDYVAYLEENHRFPLLRKLISKQRRKRASNLTRWEKMRKVCEELGPTYVKFGQIISTRPDLVPQELIVELQKLQDAVPPFPYKDVKQIIKNEFGKEVKELFLSFKEKPVASASMAQVHKAMLRDGTIVAVKIQRPGIRTIISEDITIMRDMAEMLSKRIPSLNQFDAIGIVNNFAESIQKELDFIHESWNLQRFTAQFKADKTVYTPSFYKEYSSAKVITQDFIIGVKINNTIGLEQAGLDRKIIAQRFIQSYYRQIFEYGFFHADPHAGNLIAMQDNVIAYLDFGMMGSIMKRDLQNLGNLILSIEEGDIKRIIRFIHYLGDVTVINDSRQLEYDVHEFVGKYRVSEKYQENISEMLLELKDIILKHKLKVPSHFFLLTRSMVNAEGVIRELDPSLSLNDEIRPFIVQLIQEDHNLKSFGKRIVTFATEFGSYLEDFPHDLRQVMKMAKNGEIKVDLEHKGIDPILATMEKLSRQIIITIFMVAFILGSSLVLVHKIKPIWQGMSAWAWIGFSITFILFLMLLPTLRVSHRRNRTD